ncbi:hypothetical protein BG011_007048 [Mortierella polycephala]|uniref:PUM-HD domain-containing protein n=1 Tax=Mortierella polycephala TaxID=41804 RepID=A0A9P6PTC7_9FUNG|nr:hypothetical protein BG011_007048 [Mortierella polycephala]
MTTTNNVVTLLPAPTPALESNAASRHSSRQQQQQQQQQRSSRLPNLGLIHGRILDQLPEHHLGMESSIGGFGTSLSSTENFSPSTSFHNETSLCDHPTSLSSSYTRSFWDSSQQTSFHDSSDMSSKSNSPRIENLRFVPGQTGIGNRAPLGTGSRLELGISYDDKVLLHAVVVTQRAVRRWLASRRIAKLSLSHIWDATNKNKPLIPLSLPKGCQQRANIISIGAERRQSLPALNLLNQSSSCHTHLGIVTHHDSNTIRVQPSLDLETLQQTCLRQSSEISQLKKLMTKMRVEAEEDRRKLRQRDGGIEELLKQQQQRTTATVPGQMMASRFDSNPMLQQSVNPLATSSTMPSFNAFGLANKVSVGGDSSAIHLGVSPVTDISAISSASNIDVDLCESGASYSPNTSMANPHIYPLSLQSRSNSISTSQSQPMNQQQQHHHRPSLGLKINTSQSFYQQQYHGLTGMADSPLMSEFSAQDIATTPTTSYGHGGGGGRQQYGCNSAQPSYPLLNHCHSGIFSSPSRAFDSPALEQQGSYPWSVPGSLTSSQSWADDLTSAYSYETGFPSPGRPFQNGGMGHNAGGYDPSFLNQQYSHSSQQQPQSQQHQGMSTYRSSYRRHSDKPVHLDYQICVDRILQATDQQASIHLQQKLKTSPSEQKTQIIDAILGQAYALMSNRFGNFLIQRCFEFGTPQQIEALAQAMRGNVLTLACDPFGCHVVQKALDNVEEDCKARIVTEMFRRIRETIVHRHACHVWQKVFEIRWVDAPPAVMTYVNNAVVGRWASVAVDEIGSLVVQNIFENCTEHGKRPALHEVLQSVTTIAKGQWGNWVIQHILEHGDPDDRATVTQRILEDSVSLSLDQYASKVVKKTLRMAVLASSSSIINATNLVAAATNTGAVNQDKDASNSNVNNKNANSNISENVDSDTIPEPPTITVHGTTIHLTQEEVMGQYIQIVCEGVQDRPRIPLIDIAADQYGNYIIQYILTNAGPQHRETCAALIKRHMVSLRGSKFGQKVAFMVERWRGSSYNGNHNGNNNNSNSVGNSHGGAGGALGSGHGSCGSKGNSGSGMEGGNISNGGGGGGGGGRRRW